MGGGCFAEFTNPVSKMAAICPIGATGLPSRPGFRWRGGLLRRCSARFVLVDALRRRFRRHLCCFYFFFLGFFGFLGQVRVGRILGLVVGFR